MGWWLKLDEKPLQATTVSYRIRQVMVQVKKKDSKESTENLVRRFTRRVQQAGVIANAKQNQYFEKPPSKRDRRIKAIQRRERKAQKLRRSKFGLR